MPPLLRLPVVAFVASIACVPVAAACGSFLGDASESTDGGAGDQETLVSDGSRETAVDHSPDAAPEPADARPPRLCIGAEHWACDDFDDPGGAVASVWMPEVLGDGGLGVGATPTDSPRSPPNVLHAHCPPGSRGYIHHATAANRSGVRCTFSVRVVGAMTSSANIFEMALTSQSGSYVAVVNAVPPTGMSRLTLFGASAGGVVQPNKDTYFTLADGMWHQLTIAIGLGASPVTQLIVDGETKTVMAHDLTIFNGSDMQSVSFGASTYPNAPGSWEVLFDDIVCDAIP